MFASLKTKIAIAVAAPGLMLAAPAAAAEIAAPITGASPYAVASVQGQATAAANHHRRGHNPRGHYGRYDNYDRYDRYDRGDRYDRRANYYGEPVYRDTRIWRGRDERYYCRKRDGTTGLLIGAGVGALIGNELAGRGDRTLGAILGAAGGAILGRAIDRSNARCR